MLHALILEMLKDLVTEIDYAKYVEIFEGKDKGKLDKLVEIVEFYNEQ